MEKRKGIILSDPMERYVDLDNVAEAKKQIINALSSYKRTNKSNKKIKNKTQYHFGDVLSLYGTKEKYIYVCKSNKFIYVCPLSCLEVFTGMKRITFENISSVYDVLNSYEKHILLRKLNNAFDLDKYIPVKAKKDIEKLLKQKHHY